MSGMLNQYNNHKKRLDKDIAFMIKNLHRGMNGPGKVLADDILTVELINKELNKLPEKFKLIYEQTSPILQRIYDIQRELMGLKQPNAPELANEMVEHYNKFEAIANDLRVEIGKQLATEQVAPDELLSLNGMLQGAAVSIQNQLDRLNLSIRDTLANFGIEANVLTNNKMKAASINQPPSIKPKPY